MTFYYFLLFGVVVILLLAWGIQRIRKRRAVKDLPTAYRGYRNRKDLLAQLQAWASAMALDPQIILWLRELPKQEQQRLTDDLIGFSQSAGINIAWALDTSSELAPGLHDPINESLKARLSAYYAATRHEAELALLKRYTTFIAEPNQPETIMLTRKLYVNLVKAGLAPQAPPDLILATEKERHRYSIERIQESAERDWPAFSAVLQQTLAPPPARRWWWQRRSQDNAPSTRLSPATQRISS